MELKESEKQEWVRIDPRIRDRMSRLLIDLAESIEEGRTRSGMVRHLVAALEPHLPLREFEMGWGSEESVFSFIKLTWFEGEWILTSGTLEEQFVAAVVGAIQERKVLVSLRSSEGRKQVILPFYENELHPGYARFDWQKEEALGGDLSYAMFEPLRRLLMLAQRNLFLLERVAQVSQKAYRENKWLRQEANMKSHIPSMVAVSKGMRTLLEQTRRVARYDTTILIRGESGTGKELLARHIHQMSRRSRKPFVQINCGALPEGLIESELFGHEKGAFTGAVRRHIGCFERANGGTLFLDEVAELPLPAQVKLLRVLQEGQFTRVGGETPLQVDVRIVTATHQALEAWVEKKVFREDLFFRLNVFPLSIPPLRDRREDLSVLVRHITQRLAKKMDCAVPKLQASDLIKMNSYAWPGNIRELENVLERSLILSAEGNPSFSEAISLSLSLEQEPTTLPLFTTLFQEDKEEHEVETWKVATRRCIESALYVTKGRIFGENGAAELLDLKPTTLQSKIKKLGIQRTDFVR